jgi:hypothetical protein
MALQASKSNTQAFMIMHYDGAFLAIFSYNFNFDYLRKAKYSPRRLFCPRLVHILQDKICPTVWLNTPDIR